MNSILILGNPNSGKSLLFNRLTGLTQKVANFPGVTVEVVSGQGEGFIFRDFPGIYSLQPLTRDEKVAVEHFRKALEDSETRAILYVVDATRLERSLYLLLQLSHEAHAANCPLIVALNIIDEVFAKGAKIDVEGLAGELRLEVIPISAKTSFNLDRLKAALAATPLRSAPSLGGFGEEEIPDIFEDTASLALETDPVVLPPTPGAVNVLRERARELARRFGPKADVLLVGQNRLDSFFLATFWGPIAFLAIMLLLFQSIFSWAAPMMDFISDTIGRTGEAIARHMPEAMAADFIKDAVFAGMGSFLVFMPQIFVLFVIIGILEDSGYLARATIILHKPLSWVGLSGRSFVPLLSGHACAIPAIMATRTIESPRKRLLTILAIPFMSCSARLPVYALLIAGFVPARPIIGKLVTLQGLSFFLLYAMGIIAGLCVSAFLATVMKRKGAKTPDAPFVVELPPYRMPAFKPIVKQSLSRTFDFVRKAGGIIFTVSVTIWFLGYFPKGAGHLEESYLGMAGHAIEGVFKPMGMDWKIGIAVLTSFLAREVFVGTLGTLYGIENAGDHASSLAHALQTAGMTLASAAALLVFYSLSMQCVSTLAVMRKETNDSRVPVLVFIGMTTLAYVAASISYRLLH